MATEAVLYTRNLETLGAFYRQCVGLVPVESGRDYCGLRADGLVLWLVRARHASTGDADPVAPRRRSEVPVKLAFEVASIEEVASMIEACDGSTAPATGDGSPSRICALAPGGSSTCVQSLVADTRGDLWFPSGSPDGAQIAAVLSIPAGGASAAGQIAPYSAATGGLVRDVTSGTQDTTPQFSPDGQSLVSDRAGEIVTHNLTTGAEKTLGAGRYPFWGAAGGTTTPGGTEAPQITLSLSHSTLRWVRAHQRLLVTCRLAGAGICTASVTIPARVARRLHLQLARQARTYLLGSGAARLHQAGHATLSIRLSKRTAPALRATHSLKLTITARSSAPDTTPRTATTRTTLK